jgi:hypothetical protein
MFFVDANIVNDDVVLEPSSSHEPSDEELDEPVSPKSSGIIDEVRTRAQCIRSRVSINQCKNAEKMTNEHDHRCNKKTTE